MASGLKKVKIPAIIVALVIIFSIVLYCFSHQLHRQYKAEVKEGLERTGSIENDILSEKDIEHLPESVQKYLKYVGVIGKEKVTGFKVTISGQIKTAKDSEWEDVVVEQYSFVDKPTRLFSLNLKKIGIPTVGLHYYKDTDAFLKLKVAGLMPILNDKGDEIYQSDTVTFFNDMCVLAPATLIDKRITWEPIDDNDVKATFTNEGVSVSATLFFNDEGHLTRFESEDRFYSPTGQTFEKVKWKTPLYNYRIVNGYNLITYSEAIWDLPGKDFRYAKFKILDVEYNPKS